MRGISFTTAFDAQNPQIPQAPAFRSDNPFGDLEVSLTGCATRTLGKAGDEPSEKNKGARWSHARALNGAAQALLDDCSKNAAIGALDPMMRQ